MQIRINIDDKILAILEKEAEKLGLDRNAYIQLVLGQHCQTLHKGKLK